MKEPIIQAWDDLALTEQREKLPADTTVTFGYQGEHYEIDLTSEHAIELGKIIARYIKAATRIDSMPAKKRKRRPGADGYYAGMRRFADAQEDPSLKYHPSGNGYSYPKKLRDAYDARISVTEKSHEPAKAG